MRERRESSATILRRWWKYLLLFAIAVIAITLAMKRSGPAAPAAVATSQSWSPAITCDYDVHDIGLVRIPSFISTGGNPNSLIQLIADRVAPESWKSGQGTMTSNRGTLTVANTAEAQAEVQELIRELRRAGKGAQVALTMRVLKWDGRPAPADTELEVDDITQQLVALKNGERMRMILPDGKASLLVNALQRPGTSIITAPRITIFNGQRAYVVVSTTRSYVADYNLIRHVGGVLEHQPNLNTTESGVRLDAQPLLREDGGVSVTLRPRLSNLLAMKTSAYPNPFNGQMLGEQMPVVSKFELDETDDIPPDHTLLVAGMTQIEPPSATRDYPPEHVILLLQPR